jgi:hypothetical protein
MSKCAFVGLVAPPLEGEGLGWGGLSEGVAAFIDSTPTQPSPLEGEGFRP